jgi:hypothetical protein
MGFLSKLFGGDAGPVSGKAVDEPSSAPGDDALTIGGAAANEVAVSPPRDDAGHPRETAAVAAAAAGAVDAEPAPARKVVLTGEHRVGHGNDTPLGSPAAFNLTDPPNASKAPPRALRWNPERPPPPGAAPDPGAAPMVPRRAPETPRRSAQVESSIITSAPLLGTEPQRAPAAPRPGAKPPRTAGVEPAKPAGIEPARAAADPAPAAPIAAAEGAPHRAPMSSVSGDAGLLGPRRKDRSKSPGFYSNLAPAYGSQVVSSGSTQASLRRTVVGVAPPPGIGPVAAGADVTSQGSADASAVVASAIAPEPNGALPSAAFAEDAAAPVTEASDAALAPDSAPPQGATDDLEKEETSPGVGHMPSRYDPIARSEIPERDLDLLVHFAMDLSLGLASEAWLTAVRESIGRLGAAATKLGRAGLDKALVQLGVELDAPSALSEERRGRVAQQLVLVDLALPRPMDVSGQRLLRERLIVQHLLSELSVGYPLIAQRLRDEASLTLERFARLGATELAEKAGLNSEQAEQALLVFREYLLERARRGPERWLPGKAEGLEQRLGELAASAQHFESVADGEDVQQKREARRKRQAEIARVSLFLAEWGEAGILGEFERSSVQGKIARLQRWLTELQAS